MTTGIGGRGSRRKPMAFVRALLRTDVTDLTVVTYGGPDLGLLCSANKVAKVYYGFVSLDSPPFYDPWFSHARTTGAIVAREMDEGMLRCGLQAAAQRLPFLPTRAGLGSSVPDFWDGELKTVRSPYCAEELIAMPALRPKSSACSGVIVPDRACINASRPPTRLPLAQCTSTGPSAAASASCNRRAFGSLMSSAPATGIAM